jgi:ATP-dependent DNA ligase
MDESLLNQLKAYKSLQSSKYIPVRGDEITTRVFEFEKYYVSTKIDGHLCFIFKKNKDVYLYNFNGKSFNREELISEATKKISVSSALFVGEIYHYNQGKRSRSFDLTKAISESNSVIKIGIFDLITYDNKSFEATNWLEKKKIISSVFSEKDVIHPVDEIEFTSRKEIENEFNQRVNNNNEEGIIVRGLNGPTFKIKPSLTFDFVVLGYAMGYSDDFALLKELIFGVLIEENKFLVVGKVGNGFSVDQRKNLSKQLEKIKVPSNAIETSGVNVPFTMIKPVLVAEIESIDIINSNSNGIISKSVLFFEKEFLKLNSSPSVSLISPVFKGLREDKNVTEDQTGISQITRIIELTSSDDQPESKAISAQISKEVYAKETRGIKMVKKYFIWKTNSESNNYPEYVFYKIDYSPTRSLKLQRDIKVSNNKQQITKIFNEQIKTDIKKGWNKIS